MTLLIAHSIKPSSALVLLFCFAFYGSRMVDGFAPGAISSMSATTISLKNDVNRRECTSLFATDPKKGERNDAIDVIDRRGALREGAAFFAASVPVILASSVSAPQSASAKSPTVKPDAAFESLVKARGELSVAYNTYLIKKDYDGLRRYVTDDAVNMNNYDENANVLLSSKRLDAESKVAIGTVRRYGVGADVILSYGGLKGEVAEEIDFDDINYGAVNKALRRTMDSLDEVIAICRTNGF